MFSNVLIYFVVIPLLMLAGFAICKNVKQVRAVAVTGSILLLGLSGYVLSEYLALRAAGNVDEMLFRGDWTWFAPLNIKLSVGVDGVSVAMLILS
jgi:NADH-quinone oxidoreductase subunit M